MSSKKMEMKKASEDRAKAFKAEQRANKKTASTTAPKSAKLEDIKKDAKAADPKGAATEKASTKATKQAEREAAKAAKASIKSKRDEEKQRYYNKVLELGGKSIEVEAHDEVRPDGTTQHHKSYTLISHTKESMSAFAKNGLPMYPKQWLAEYLR